jgi:hypothetical protein
VQEALAELLMIGVPPTVGRVHLTAERGFAAAVSVSVAVREIPPTQP